MESQTVDINSKIIKLGDKVVYNYKGENHGCFHVVFENHAFRKKYPNWDETLLKPLLEIGEEAKSMNLMIVPEKKI